MKQLFYLFLLIFGSSSLFGQKYTPFQGKLVYRVEFRDSASQKSDPPSIMTLYTNDTLVRIESETMQLGQQILIKHLQLHKYYILLEVNEQKFAIQHTEAKDTVASKYVFKHKRGSKLFDGKKAKKILVSTPHYPKPLVMYYFKDINPIYLEAIKGIPGLPAEYFLRNEDGIYHYTLIDFSEEKPSKDLFGVPSDYKKVSFDEFIQLMVPSN